MTLEPGSNQRTKRSCGSHALPDPHTGLKSSQSLREQGTPAETGHSSTKQVLRARLQGKKARGSQNGVRGSADRRRVP